MFNVYIQPYGYERLSTFLSFTFTILPDRNDPFLTPKISAFGPQMKRMINRKALLDCIFLISETTRQPCGAELEP